MRIKVIPYNTTEYGSLSAFPGTGESGKYYLALDTMILYVWSSNAYTAASFRYEGKPTYHGSYLKSGYLEFTMAASPAPIDWHSGDYIRYDRTGRVYKMYNTPQTERQSGTNHNGDSFAYRNVQFYDSVKELELTPFRDYVQGQNQYFFSSKQDVQTIEPVSGIVARLNANLADYFGSGVWNVTIAENIPSSFEVDVAKDYSVSGTCLDALNAIYETWNELGWGFSVVNGVNTITIGYPNVAPATSGNHTNVFSYGSGLTALKRNTGSLNDFCTRMHVFGTERNLINRYYNGKDIYNAASVYIPNLMIPLEHWGTTSSKPDASKAYIEDADKIALYGLITKDVYFDGTDGKPEVYPSIEEQTIEVLKAAKTTLGKTGAGAPDYYPQTNDDTIRVDAVKSIVTMPLDNGSLSSSGSRYIDTYDATISSPLVNGQSRTSRSAGEIALYEYTFDDSGIVDVKWEGALKFVLNQALGASDYLVLRLRIYKGSVGRSNLLDTIDFSKVSDVTNGQILSLDITKAIGTRESQFTGKILVNLEYYFVASGGGTRTITITKEGDITTSVGLREALASTFKIKTQQIGFDISKMTSSGGATLALKSGMCAGREFPITRAVYNSSDDSWTLTCKRTQDNSTEIYYPNAQFPIVADELFVILGITMPEEYILAQSERLYALGQELYNRVSVYKPSYEPSIDSKQVLANITAHPSDEQYKLIEGKYMRLYDTDIIGGDHSAEVLITELTIGEGDAEIATYRVVLSDKATVSGGITRSIANISNEVQQMQSAQRSAMRGYESEEGSGTMPDGGTNVNPVFIKDGVPQAVDGIDVPEDIHTGSAISADGNLSVGGNADIDGNANIDGNATIGGDADVDGDITSEHGDIQALAGGVSANGIADLSESGGGGAGTVTDVKVNNVSQPQTDGTVSITVADVALSGNYNDLNNKPTIPAAQIQSDWNQTNTSSADYIKNKPTIANSIKFDANVSYQETTPFTPINGLISLPAYKTWSQLLPSGGIPNTDLANSSITLNSNTISLGNTISLATFLSYLGANQASGVLQLGADAKIPIAQIPDAILGQLVYGGTFVPSTGVASLSTGAQYKLQTTSTSITLTNDTTATTGYGANEGIYYLASAAGTFAGLSFQDGDWLVSTGNAWKKIDNTDAVTSVNSQIGAVTIGLAVVGDTIQVTTGSNNAITVPFATKAEKDANGNTISTYYQVKVTALGSTTEPVYISAAGTFSKASKYAGGTLVNLNGTNRNSDTATFYAPVGSGILNQVLLSTGTNTSPVWADQSDITAGDSDKLDGKHLNQLFTLLENDNNQISITIGTVNKKLTVAYASVAGKLGTSNVGSASLPIYLSAGVATTISSLSVTGAIQSTGSGVSANGIADLAMVSGGGSGTLTQIKINTVALTDADGVVTIPISTGLDVNSSTGAISVSSTFQTQIGHGETAYNWGNHALAGYAVQGADNNLIYHTDEFNFLPSGFSSTTVWLNYRTKGTAAANDYVYRFGNGKGNAGYASVQALKFIVNGGAGTQFLKGDGTLDSTTYLPTSGGTITSNLIVNGTLSVLTGNLYVTNTGSDTVDQWIKFDDTSGINGAIGIRRAYSLYGLTFRYTADGGTNYAYYKILHEGNYSSILGSVYAPYNANGYLPLNGGTMTGTIKWRNDKTGVYDLGYGTATPSGYTIVTAGGNYTMGLISYDGASDEGGVLAGSDCCVVYNSGDSGCLFKVINKDTSQDFTGDDSATNCAFYISEGMETRAKWLRTNDLSLGSIGGSGYIGVNYSASDTSYYNYIYMKNANNGSDAADNSDIWYVAGTWTGGQHPAHRFKTNSNNQALVIYNPYGYVGINTDTPAYNLDVEGTIQFSGDLLMQDGHFLYSTGRRILGCEHTDSHTAWTSFMLIPDNDADDAWQVRPYGGTRATAHMTILHGGNVGIGTSDPAAKLHIRAASGEMLRLAMTANYVAGNGPEITFKNDIYEHMASIGAYWAENNNGNYANLYFGTRTSDSTGVTAKMTILYNGKVGIGTTAPSEMLHTVGNIRSARSGDAASYVDIKTDNDCGLYIHTNNQSQWAHLAGYGNLLLIYNGAFDTVGSGNAYSGLVIDTNNNIGLGVASPAYKLDIKTHIRYTYSYFWHNGEQENAGYIGCGSSSKYVQLYVASGYTLDLPVDGKNNYLNSTGLSIAESVTAKSFVKSGGTSGQFLKADGSVDSTDYAIRQTGNNLCWYTDEFSFMPADFAGSQIWFNYRTAGDSSHPATGSSLKYIFADGKATGGLASIECANISCAAITASSTIQTSSHVISAAGFYTTGSNVMVSKYWGSGVYNVMAWTLASNHFEFEFPNATDEYSGAHCPVYFGWRGGIYPLTLAANGNVGIGTTSPGNNYTLDVNGVSRCRYNYFYHQTNQENAGYIGCGSASSNVQFVVESGYQLQFVVGGNSSYITGSGMEVSGYILPSTGVYLNSSGGIYTNNSTTKRKIYGWDYDDNEYSRMMAYAMLPDNDANDGWQIRPWLGSYSSAYLTVLHGGNIGVNTLSPQAKFHIEGASGELLRLSMAETDYTAYHGPEISFWHGTSEKLASIQAAFQESSNGNKGMLLVGTRTSDSAGVETKMYILNNGWVGLSHWPSYTLDVAGTIRSYNSASASVYLYSSGDPGIYVTSGGQWIHYAGNGGLMLFYNGAYDSAGSGNWNQGLSITTSNYIGVGTATPQAKFDVAGTVRANSIVLGSVVSTSNNYIEGVAGSLNFGGNFHIDSRGSNHLYLNYYTGYNIYMCYGSSRGTVFVGGSASFASTLSVSGTATHDSYLDMKNGCDIRCYDSGGSSVHSAMVLDGSNTFAIGYGMTGYTTALHGNTIQMKLGSSRTVMATVNSSGINCNGGVAAGGIADLSMN